MLPGRRLLQQAERARDGSSREGRAALGTAERNEESEMPTRRGAEYLESLRDGRRVWLMGQPVEDVTTHPALAGCATSGADAYDPQHDPRHRDLLTMPSPTTGERVSLAYLLPGSAGDLARQRRMYEHLVRRAGGVAARLPQHLATVALGLYDVRDLLGKADPRFAE